MNTSVIKRRKELKKTTGIAMTDSLKARLVKAADSDGRSVSDFVCRLLEKKLA